MVVADGVALGVVVGGAYRQVQTLHAVAAMLGDVLLGVHSAGGVGLASEKACRRRAIR